MVFGVMADVFVGLALTFAVMGLVVSALTEALAKIFSWRANTLVDGLRTLLDDPNLTGLAGELLNHGQIVPHATQGNVGQPTTTQKVVLSLTGKSQSQVPTVKPNWVDAEKFATSLVDILRNRDAVKNDIGTAIKSLPDSQVKTVLNTFYTNANTDIAAFEKDVAGWFDNGMAEVSKFYQARVFWWNLGIALGATVLLNVDAFAIAHAIWQQPSIADALTSQVKDTATASQAIAALQAQTGFPMGWPGITGQIIWDKLWCADRLVPNLAKAGGFLATTVAALQGAPFWFDLLKSVKDAGKST